MMSGVKLFDREVVHADELDAPRYQILRAVRREERVVPDKLRLREKSRVSGLEQHSRVLCEIVLAQLTGAHRHNIVRERDQQRGPDQLVEPNLVDRLAVVEEMLRGVNMCPGVRSETHRRYICARAFGYRLLELDADLRVSRIH